jgi:hypothetical protein
VRLGTEAISGVSKISFWVISRISSMILSKTRWLAIAFFIFSAFAGVNPRLTVFPLTFLVHLHALGGWGMTLPWLKASKLPIREARAR